MIVGTQDPALFAKKRDGTTEQRIKTSVHQRLARCFAVPERLFFDLFEFAFLCPGVRVLSLPHTTPPLS